MKASGRIFLEAAPRGPRPAAIGEALVASPDVVEVHDLHVWEITSGFPALRLTCSWRADSDCHAARRELEAMLHEPSRWTTRRCRSTTPVRPTGDPARAREGRSSASRRCDRRADDARDLPRVPADRGGSSATRSSCAGGRDLPLPAVAGASPCACPTQAATRCSGCTGPFGAAPRPRAVGRRR